MNAVGEPDGLVAFRMVSGDDWLARVGDEWEILPQSKTFHDRMRFGELYTQ